MFCRKCAIAYDSYWRTLACKDSELALWRCRFAGCAFSAQNKPVRSERLFVGFTEYFKAPAYCSCSETVAHLKVPVAASSFSWFLSGEKRRHHEIIYIQQSLNY